MTRRRLSLLLAVVGVLIILASVIGAAVVRSVDSATLSIGERPDVPVVITEPGLLDAVDPDVTIRAIADDDEQVVLAVGRTSEVEAWLGGAEHARITGLTSWEELTVEVVTATEPSPEPTAAATETPTGEPAEETPAEGGVPNPAGSDLWLAESVGTGSTELDWTDRPGRWSLVAATDGTGPAPDIELEWGRQVSTPWLVPGIVIGGLAIVAALTLLVLDVLARREQRRRDDARARQAAAGEDGYRISITDTDPGTGERLTRRQIRELEQRMAEEDSRLSAGEPGEPPVPLAPGTTGVGNAPADPQSTAVEHPPADDAVAPDDRPSDDDGASAAPAERDTDRRAGTEPVEEPAAPEPGGDEPPAPPSWRSVWGFGGATVAPPTQPRPSPPDTPTQDTDGEEQR